ncbi:hypothetical protein JHK82_050510 [Glycine max]|nr:hypothetical protein JHK82_050510 [Glycine max]
MEDGYFKIRRGKNECGIEEDVTAGWPSTKNLVIEALLGDPQPLGEQQRVVEVIGCIATELGWVGELLDRLRSLQILLSDVEALGHYELTMTLLVDYNPHELTTTMLASTTLNERSLHILSCLDEEKKFFHSRRPETFKSSDVRSSSLLGRDD